MWGDEATAALKECFGCKMVNRKGESGHPYLVLLCNVKLCDVSPLVITQAAVYIILIQLSNESPKTHFCFVYMKNDQFTLWKAFFYCYWISVYFWLKKKLIWSGWIMRRCLFLFSFFFFPILWVSVCCCDFNVHIGSRTQPSVLYCLPWAWGQCKMQSLLSLSQSCQFVSFWMW